jgi:hypothetical protein
MMVSVLLVANFATGLAGDSFGSAALQAHLVSRKDRAASTSDRPRDAPRLARRRRAWGTARRITDMSSFGHTSGTKPGPDPGPHRADRCALRRKIPAQGHLLSFSKSPSCAFIPNPCPTKTPPAQQKTPHLRGFYTGAPDLNRGPHRPELWAKPEASVRSTCKSVGSGVALCAASATDLGVDPGV